MNDDVQLLRESREKGYKEVIGNEEVEFVDGPMYLVIGAPRNPKGYPFLRIAGDFAVWSMTNSAPF